MTTEAETYGCTDRARAFAGAMGKVIEEHLNGMGGDEFLFAFAACISFTLEGFTPEEREVAYSMLLAMIEKMIASAKEDGISGATAVRIDPASGKVH